MHKNLIFLIFFITFALGSDTSRVVETYNNGKISSISYFKDTEKGLDLIKQEVFHFTGLMSMVGTFENGFREGIWTYWYEDGQKRLVCIRLSRPI